VPGILLGVSSGIDVGDSIQFKLTGSNGEIIQVSYLTTGGTIAAQNNELLAQINMDFAADSEGEGIAFRVSQLSGGGSIELRYIKDIDGFAALTVTGFTDSVADDAVLSVSALAGSTIENADTQEAVSQLTVGVGVSVSAIDVVATAEFRGSLGGSVTLVEGGVDSSTVAGTINYTLQDGYTIASTTAATQGGILAE